MNSSTTYMIEKTCVEPGCDNTYLIPNDAKQYSLCCSRECKAIRKQRLKKRSDKKLRITNKKIKTRIEAARYIHKKQGGLTWTQLWSDGHGS